MAHRISSGIYGLDKLLNGGIVKNSVTLVSGPAGTGKTIFCLQFLAEGAKKGEKGVFVCFEQRLQDVIDQAQEFGWDFEKWKKQGLIKLVVMNRPKFVPGEFVADKIGKVIEQIQNISKEFNADRIAIDSIFTLITILPTAFDVGCRRKAIIELVQRLKDINATAIITSELAENSRWYSRDKVSEFVCDGLLVLRNTFMGNQVNRTIEIRKMRSTPITAGIFSFDFTKKGIKISE